MWSGQYEIQVTGLCEVKCGWTWKSFRELALEWPENREILAITEQRYRKVI